MSDEGVYNHPTTTTTAVEVEPETVQTSDRGLFDVFGKKNEEKKCEEAAISSEFEEKVQVSEPVPEEKKETLLDKLHRSGSSSSSSSSDEECDENGEKKKKKKPLKEKIKEKITKHEDETSVPIEKYDVAPLQHTPNPEPEEKKGFMEKIKEKLPGGHKKVEEEYVAPPPPPPTVVTHPDEGEQKKGIFEKIKEKIPGYHPKSEEEKEKEKEKECH
ncbi:hypothetical protein LXL04_022257 [Taraxacum kok-saghyz]